MAGKVLSISLSASLAPLQKALENVGKMMNDFASSIEKTDKKIADSIRTNVAEMNSSLSKVKESFINTEKAGDDAGKKGTASLRQQLRQATMEAQRLAQTVGMSDPKFVEAAKRAAALKDEMGDVNNAIQAMNPDERFKGVASALSGSVKVIAGMQGAMAAFGVESDNAAQVMAKLQGMMALSEGLNAMGSMKDTLKILGTQATAFGTALKAAIGSTGIGLLIIAVGALAANWDKIMSVVSGVSKEQEKLHESLQKSIKSKQRELEMFDAQKAQMLLAGKSEREILQARMQRINMVIKEMSADLALQKQMRDGQIAAAQRNKDILVGIIDFLARPIKALLTGIDAIGEAFGAQWDLVKKFESFEGSIANVFFDPKEVKEKADKQIQESELALEKMKSDYAQAQLDIKAIDKKQADDKKKSEADKVQAIMDATEKELQIQKAAFDEQQRINAQLRAERYQQVIEQQKMLADNLQAVKESADRELEVRKKTGLSTLQLDEQFEKLRRENADLSNEEIYKKIEESFTSYAAANKMAAESAQALNQALQNMAAQGIAMAAEALGTALAGGAVAFGDLLGGLVSMVADTANQLGKQFIAMGTAALVATTQLFSNPVAAIAAGAALVAASAAAKQLVKSMAAPKKMEQGGLIYGNSFVNVGEYGNAHTNPEVIAPLSKLKGLLPQGNSQDVRIHGLIQGNAMAVVNAKQGRAFTTITGRRSL